jgi:hypothetical protein
MTDWLSKNELRSLFDEKAQNIRENLANHNADEAITALFLMVREMKEAGMNIALENLAVAPRAFYSLCPGTYPATAFAGLLHIGASQLLIGILMSARDLVIAVGNDDWRLQCQGDNASAPSRFSLYSYLNDDDCICNLQKSLVETLARDSVIRELDKFSQLMPTPRKQITSNLILG